MSHKSTGSFFIQLKNYFTVVIQCLYQVRSEAASQCLDAKTLPEGGMKTTAAVITYPCHGEGGNQVKKRVKGK